jgi:hypothetical protein
MQSRHKGSIIVKKGASDSLAPTPTVVVERRRVEAAMLHGLHSDQAQFGPCPLSMTYSELDVGSSDLSCRLTLLLGNRIK